MKMAIKDGQLILSDLGIRFQQIREWGTMKWDRKLKVMTGPANYENLLQLSEMCQLPEAYQPYFEKVKAQHEAIEAERLNPDPVPLVDYPVKVKLYAHQVRGANMALRTFEAGGGFGFLFEMGCGKTLTAVATMGALYEQGKIQKVLIVAPGTVCPVWPKELEDYAAFRYQAELLMGEKKKRLEALARLASNPFPGLKVAVINYEAVFREGIEEALMAWDPDMVIADESQRIKTHSAKQSKAMHEFGDRARYKLILTGTPIQNNAVDFFSQYRFLDKSVFGSNFYSYKARYCIMGGFERKQIVGYRHMDELKRKAHGIAYRVTKAECLDLPEQTFTNIMLDLKPAERRVYDQLKKASVAELENGGLITAATVLTKILRLQQMTGGFALADDKEKPTQANTAKLDALSDILDDYVLEEGKKLVIFARFRPEIAAIAGMLEKKGIQYGLVHGDVSMDERGQVVKDFQENSETKVFLAQLQTANFGITLTAASTAVFYSWDYNYANYQQATARIHRIGQRHPCTYIHLVVRDTIDEKVLKALKAKEDIATDLVDNWRDFFN